MTVPISPVRMPKPGSVDAQKSDFAKLTDHKVIKASMDYVTPMIAKMTKYNDALGKDSEHKMELFLRPVRPTEWVDGTYELRVTSMGGKQSNWVEARFTYGMYVDDDNVVALCAGLREQIQPPKPFAKKPRPERTLSYRVPGVFEKTLDLGYCPRDPSRGKLSYLWYLEYDAQLTIRIDIKNDKGEWAFHTYDYAWFSRPFVFVVRKQAN